MEFSLFIYFIGLFGKVGVTLEVLLVLSCIATFVSPIPLHAMYHFKDIELKTAIKIFKIETIVTICLSVAYILVPSEKTMWMAAGAYGAQKAVESELSEDFQDILKLKLKKYKHELQEEVMKETKDLIQ